MLEARTAPYSPIYSVHQKQKTMDILRPLPNFQSNCRNRDQAKHEHNTLNGQLSILLNPILEMRKLKSEVSKYPLKSPKSRLARSNQGFLQISLQDVRKWKSSQPQPNIRGDSKEKNKTGPGLNSMVL